MEFKAGDAILFEIGIRTVLSDLQDCGNPNVFYCDRDGKAFESED